MTKNEIRTKIKELRKNMEPCDVEIKSKNACENLIKSGLLNEKSTVMLYFPLGKETDTRILFDYFSDKGITVLLPVTNNDIITPVKLDKNSEFEKGEYNIFEPSEKVIFPKEKIDAVIVPGIAFDKRGARVGFGKGCYDRFLRCFDVLKIGFCYDFQLVDKIENDENDINMDYIVSDKEVIYCE